MKNDDHRSRILQKLVKYRVTIASLYIAVLMFLSFWAALIFGVTSEQFKLSKTIIDLIPVTIFISVALLLVFYVFTGILKYWLMKKGTILDHDPAILIPYEDALVFGSRKIKILMACWGSFTAILMIAAITCILFGLDHYLEYFSFLILFGVPIWFLTTWRFFSSHIK